MATLWNLVAISAIRYFIDIFCIYKYIAKFGILQHCLFKIKVLFVRVFVFHESLLYDYRMIGIFNNSIIADREFRSGCKIVIALAWLLALLPMVPTAFKQFGRYGLECKTRKCTVINMGLDGNPTSVNPKLELGRWSPVIAGILLIAFNGAIVLRLRVSHHNVRGIARSLMTIIIFNTI